MYYGHSFVDTASSAILVLRIMCSGCSGTVVQWELSYMITRSSIYVTVRNGVCYRYQKVN